MNYIEELLPDLLLQAPDISDTALRRALRLSTQDYFRAAEVWLPEPCEFFTFPQVARYDLLLPEGSRIARVLWVKVDGCDLAPLEQEHIAEGHLAGYTITNDHPHQIVFTSSAPRGAVKVGVALYPTPQMDEIPDWLIFDYRTPLVAAALAQVYGAPGSPWFDPALAATLEGTVERSILHGKRIASNRKQGRRRTVRYGGY